MSLRENNQRVTNPGGSIELLEITNPGFSEPMRIANNSEDVASQGVTYVGVNFGFTLPEDVSGSAPRMQLTMGNAGTSITDELERITPGSITMARLIIIDRSEPDVQEKVFKMPISSVVCTPSAATATAGWDEIMRQAAVKQIANQHTLPGIF
ncbi:protein of unknown function [Roseateles sp. YR242]|uniref:DUF1833 family protein n=1 Tax=Roseateles sp. YR242 TaxID=1855305 RepID=UPI0008BED7FD|nr:DUF1833 family protein [Roseateles sp. YR242]SEL11908.1 protein of unknown function [Roseateles sp. YR242]